MNHIDTFSGIGGASLAVDAVWPESHHVFVEIDPFCQAVLKKHWPHAPIYDDIKTFKGENYRGAGILTGGFPCQPFSSAGRRKGTEDDRHLWPEMLRVIREARPRWIVGENVGGLITWNGGMVLEGIVADLEAEGYEVAPPLVIPACAVGAPHRRDRVWIVAHDGRGHGKRKALGWQSSRSDREEKTVEFKRPNSRNGNEPVAHHAKSRVGKVSNIRRAQNHDINGKTGGAIAYADYRGSRGSEGNASQERHQTGSRKDGKLARGSEGSHRYDTHTKRAGLERKPENEAERQSRLVGGAGRHSGGSWEKHWLEVATELCLVDDGLPNGLARPRGWRNAALKGAGNAWVPQVAIEIMKAIKEIDTKNHDHQP